MVQRVLVRGTASKFELRQSRSRRKKTLRAMTRVYRVGFREHVQRIDKGLEISTHHLGVYLVGDYRKKISTFILPQFSGKTAGLYPVLAPDQSVSLVQIQEAGPWRPTANSVYISLGLEMINRPIHYLFRKVMYLMKKRSSTLGELLFDECVV